MPANKKPAAPKATTAKKTTPAATAAKSEKPTPPVPTLDKITSKHIVRIWLKDRKGCWGGTITKVAPKELTFCVRWHKDSPPMVVKRADVTKLEVKQGAKYLEVTGV
jgi:hypothetical protein